MDHVLVAKLLCALVLAWTQIMNIEILGSIGEFLGGIGVVISLIYVGIQVKQSNVLAIAASEREVQQGTFNINHFKAEHAAVFRQGINDFSSLSKDDQLIFSLVMSSEMNFLDQMIKMRDKGLATDYDVDTWGDWCISLVTSDGGKAWWEMVGPILYDDSGRYVVSRLELGEDLPPPVTKSVEFLGADT